MEEPIVASPTGETLFPPQTWRWIVWVFGIVALVSLALSELFPGARWAEVQLKIVFAVGVGGGLMSPGWRKPTALVLAAFILLPGCTGVRVRPDLGGKVADCAGSALVSLAPDAAAALPKVAEALQGGSADWQPELDKVLVTGGMAAWCALMALIRSIEIGGTGGGEGATLLVLRPAEAPGGLPPATLLLRGYAYLDSRSR
jgi:hypothetical protein